MIQPLLLVAFCIGIAFSASPGPVTNLKAVQEGFNGIISLSWERPAGFPTTWKDFYKFTVTDSNNGVVIFKTYGTIYGDATNTIVELKEDGIGKTYNIEVICVQADLDQEGESATTTITLHNKDNAIPSPTNFQYAGLDYESSYLQWEWNVEDAAQYKNVRFFVMGYTLKEELELRQASTTNTSIVLSNLAYNSFYKMKIFAHASGPKDSDPERTSEVLIGEMPAIEFLDLPEPRDSKIVVSKENTTPDLIPYTVSWTMAPRAPDQKLIGMSLEICDGSDATLSCGDLLDPTDGYVDNWAVSLKHGTDYAIHCYAVYDMGLNKTYNRYGSSVWLHTPNMPSDPVKNLVAEQHGTSADVILTWERPEKTNGDLVSYEIHVKNSKGAENQGSKLVGAALVRYTVTVKNAEDGQRYNFTVTPITRGAFGDPDLDGETASTGLVLKIPTGAGFPTWAIIFIVVVVLALIGGVGYYFKQRSKPTTTHSTRPNAYNF